MTLLLALSVFSCSTLKRHVLRFTDNEACKRPQVGPRSNIWDTRCYGNLAAITASHAFIIRIDSKEKIWSMPPCTADQIKCTTSAILAALTLFLASGCSSQTDTAAPQPRPVRTVTVEQRAAGATITLTGRIEAEDEVALAFRISGRLLENDRKLGDRIEAGQVVARLESQNERNALRAAQANLIASQGQLTQARNHFERQDTLLKQGWTTRANHDQAKQALQTAESQVDAAEAQVKTAFDQVSFTEIKADAPGVITAVGPAAGEVVQAGQMILSLARRDRRDAVFDVPAQVLRTAASDPRITVSLTDDPKVTTTGRVREVSPQADPVTRTFAVKVGLNDPPPAID